MSETQLEMHAQAAEACTEDYLKYGVDNAPDLPSSTEAVRHFTAWAVAYSWCDLEDNGSFEEQYEFLASIIVQLVPPNQKERIARIVSTILDAYEATLQDTMDAIQNAQ